MTTQRTETATAETSKTETHKVFNDPIHGHIELPQICVQIIDTSVFQRLRHIKQLGTTYKVYPGASHNRFEHSLGVCHLAGKFVERLRAVQCELFKTRPELKTEKADFEISDQDALCLQVAGLCHDLGHGPLSHVFETRFIQKIASDEWTHEKMTCKLLDYLWEDVFKNGSPKLEERDFKFIKELIHKSPEMTAEDRETQTGRSSKKDFLYEIISNHENKIDVDKWDYFARDCYHLGFKNNFDHNRLIQFSRLIEVEEENKAKEKEKRWHICYREKEVENLYHMFYSRVILHRRACLHKTTRIIEIMYMEALEKVNEHLKIKGKAGKETKISDCIHDSVAYCKLTDNIFDLIRYMGQLCKEHDHEATEQAILILDKIEKRQLYKLIGEATYDPKKEKFDKSEFRKEEGEIQEAISVISGGNLNRKEFLIDMLEFSYGGKENPMNKVYFYLKSDPDNAIGIKREQVSDLLPTVFCEQVVRMYSRKQLNDEETKQYRAYFHKWCEKNNMKGKWRLYAAATTTSE